MWWESQQPPGPTVVVILWPRHLRSLSDGWALAFPGLGDCRAGARGHHFGQVTRNVALVACLSQFFVRDYVHKCGVFGIIICESLFNVCVCVCSIVLCDIVCYYGVCHTVLYCRRKFRSETSDNMDSWKAEVRRVRREKIRRKKMQVREKVGKSRNTVFFQWFVALEGRKVGSLKRRVRSQLARWEMKNCTPLWREAHFQVKMYKTHQVRTTFGSWDVEKVHAVVARSTFPSQNVQNTPAPDHFWKLRCRKSARRCGAKHISKSKWSSLPFPLQNGGSWVPYFEPFYGIWWP